MEYGIEKFAAQKGLAVVEMDMAALTPDIIMQLALHGAKQKIVDAAAGAAKVAKETDSDVVGVATGLMAKVVDNLLAGEWGVVRGAGAGYDSVDREIIKMVRDTVKGANAAWYKDATPRERDEACMEAFSKAPDSQRDAITAMAEKRVERAKAEKTELGGLNFTA